MNALRPFIYSLKFFIYTFPVLNLAFLKALSHILIETQFETTDVT